MNRACARPGLELRRGLRQRLVQAGDQGAARAQRRRQVPEQHVLALCC
jgi:hypothetical protein